jgi:hypothetical protein
VATIGVEQRTFRTTGMGCVGECEPIGISKKTVIGNMHGYGNFEKNYHWAVGLATIGVEQHTSRTTVMGCAGGSDPLEFQKKTIIGNMHGDGNFQKNYHWAVGLATIGVEQHTFRTTVFVCVWVGVVPSGLGGGGSSQATRRTCFTVNFPSGDGSARKALRAAPAAAVGVKQPPFGANCTRFGGLGSETEIPPFKTETEIVAPETEIVATGLF